MKDLSNFLKSISDETRLRILTVLYRKELCVCEICDILEESQPKISRHLAKLRDAEFVKDKRQGQWVFYYANLNDDSFREIMESIISRIEKYPQLKQDMDRLAIKVSNNNLCTRIN